MAEVQTVRGPVDSAELGTTLLHEHVFVLEEEIRQNYPDYWDEEYRVADAVGELREVTQRGVATIVDPTVVTTPVAPKQANRFGLVTIGLVSGVG
jgi:phosphotriesterase-related protein